MASSVARRRASPPSAPGDGEVATPSRLIAERVALGRALEGRLTEVAGLTAERAFPGRRLAPSAFDSAVLATRIIARWLVDGQGATGEEEAELASNGHAPLVAEGSFGGLAKSYLAWRDVTSELIVAESRRLGVSAATTEAALHAVGRSTDASLVHMCRRFDAARGQLEALVSDERRRLAHTAMHDQLTELPNRLRLFEMLRSTPGELAVLFVDLDHFKAVNDRFGHAGGDELLQAAAARMASVVRRADALARLAGDEFVIVVSGSPTPAVDAARLAERLRSVLAEPFTVAGHHVRLSASIGIAVRRPDDGPDGLIERADRAMYHAKSAGRDRWVTYTERIGADAERRDDLRRQLGTALSRGELSLVYQRITDPVGGCRPAEALLRWSHPTFGGIAPAEFIPLAEQTGLIVDIGEWVLAAALRQCRAWRAGGWARATVAVNVSPMELRDGIVDRVRSALADSRLPPGALVLEITETAVIDEAPEKIAALESLRALGVGLAIDDFGTGYASLAYLRTLPLSHLKIDRSFTRGIHRTGADRLIVQATIDLGHALGLVVTAEGVETTAELRALTAMGCDQLQGYLLGRPVAADDFDWATSWPPPDPPDVDTAS
ncbi:MAG TPA: bifunctional diguanylate cyclase/phosphodiesterase [Acidimicrobiales bacterium]|nr:bifunctional diguanylate cyclase/phosphodiesterase [Acidimicrobiales bacterium]